MKIDSIEIKNFKSLKDIKLTFSNLTLITGVNSSGKSSLIQTLLFLKRNENIQLFNKLKCFTNIQNIFHQGYDGVSRDISIVLKTVEKELNLSFSSEKILKKDYDGKDKINLFNKTFQYMETNRIPPQIDYEISYEHLENDNLGNKGEYTTHYLSENKFNKININNLKHPNAMTSRLIENVSLWLSEISIGIEITTKIYPELGKVSLSYSYNNERRRTSNYSPLNVGFGITFVLPVIVAILKTKPNDLLIIENPESHLHPKAQSKIAELCAIASENGVQIIVETHSDHFLNGIRVATKKGILTSEQSSIYYFRKEKDEWETKITKIHIDKDGGIDDYPKGFFDQFDNDLDQLIQW